MDIGFGGRWVGEDGPVLPRCQPWASPREAAACGRGWSPPGCTRGRGDTHSPGATRSWCKREGETLNPQLCPCAAAHGRDALGGVEGLGVPAKGGWCHTKGIFAHCIQLGNAAFHPRFEQAEPNAVPCRTVPPSRHARPRRRHASPGNSYEPGRLERSKGALARHLGTLPPGTKTLCW